MPPQQTPPPGTLATDGAPVLQVPPPKPEGIPVETAFTIIAVFLGIVAISGSAYYYWLTVQTSNLYEVAAVTYPLDRMKNRGSGLGSDIYKTVSNPIASNIPVTGSSYANPLAETYTNPFSQ